MERPVIAIVGGADPGRKYDVPVHHPQNAQEAARELGGALARAGFRIAVYSGSPKFIERYFVEGYLSHDGAAKQSIEVRYRAGHGDCEEFPLYKERMDRFYQRPSHEPVWEVSFYRSIRCVDGLILLGGGPSTRIAGLLAIADRKPLLSIATFGGGAAEVLEYLGGLKGEAPDSHTVTLEQISLMRDAWTAQSAEKLVACLAEQVRHYEQLRSMVRFEEDITKDRENGLRIAWLSDLHMTCEPDRPLGLLSRFRRRFQTLLYLRQSPLTQHFPKTNLEMILDRVQAIKPHHILVTGDLTNYAQDNEFSEVRDLFKKTQMSIKCDALPDLDPEFWTILPGNHDVTWANRAQGRIRRNLGSFFKHFDKAFHEAGRNYDDVFPLKKPLSTGAPNGIRVLLLGLDSTQKHPVWLLGANARGRIDEEQFRRLQDQLSEEKEYDSVLVALHHHPVVVPEIVPAMQEHFLSLKEKCGKDLIKVCAQTNVAAILHGHWHAFSRWSLSREGVCQMAIVGSPCGTMQMPGRNVTFLELREAWQESRWGPRTGLALYRHAYADQAWKEQYITFID